MKKIGIDLRNISISVSILIFVSFITIFFSISTYANQNGEVSKDFVGKTYSVGYFTNGFPLQYMSDDGEPEGLAIEILNCISECSDIKFEYYPIVNGTTEEEANSLDMIASFTQINDYNNKIYLYNDRSVAYYEIPLFLSGMYGFDFNEVTKVGVFDYKYLDDQQIHDLMPNAEVYRYKTVDDLEKDFLSGKIDFAFTTNVIMQMLLRADIENTIQSYPLTLTVPLEIVFSDMITDEEQAYINNIITNRDQDAINNIILENSKDYSLDEQFLRERELYSSTEMMKNVVTAIVVIIILGVFIVQIYKYYMEKITFYDKITNFYTEYKFSVEADKILTTAKPDEYVIISADIDNFKYINEMYDFTVGTGVLQRFASNISSCYKESSLFSRIHADNFLVLMPYKSYLDCKDNFKMSDFSDLVGDSYHVYSSQGVFKITDTSQPLSTMIDCANFARTIGKDTHGNTIVDFTPKMDKEREVKNRIISNMERALIEKEFEVFYQPKIDLHTKTTCGAEALIRWVTKGNHTIFPDEFIPLFEKNRYITKLDLYVFREVCIFIDEYREKIGNVVTSVNLSTITLLIEGIDEILVDILKEYNIPVELVELEVTESAFIDNLELVIKQVSRLKSAGFTIALDDFGSGISSLNQLKNIEIDVLKIDKAFLSDSLEESKGIIVIKNVINLAKNLDLKIVAEGVETLESSNILADLGCDIAQGYYYARPMKLVDFKEFLKIEKFD